MKIMLSLALACSLVACRFETGAVKTDAGETPTPCTSDAAAPDSAAPDAGTSDSAAPDSATPDAGTGPRTWTCSFVEKKFGPDTSHATNCSDTNLEVDVSYIAEEADSGEVSVKAEVGVPSAPPALSSTRVWSAGSVGASQATNTLLDDICRGSGPANGGTWSFTLDKTTGVLTSVYTDADLIAGQLTFTTPCNVAPTATTHD